MVAVVAARRAAYIRLTDDARRGWDRVVESEGVSLTALVEAVGLALHERREIIPKDIIAAARAIDYERGSRR